jgi:heptosyltransferase-2
MAPERILVRLPNWTGDVVMATPGLRALRSGYGSARITAHVRPGLEPLLAGLPFVDEVRPVRSWHRGLRALLDEGRALRADAFDLGLCLPDSWSSLLLMRAARVGEVAGHRRGGRGLLLQRRAALQRSWGVRRPIARERHVLRVVEAAGCSGGSTELELRTTAGEEAEADALLAPLAGRVRFVVLAPGASYGSAKRWPPASFAAVADALTAAGTAVVVVGSEPDAAVGRAVCAAARTPLLDLCGRTGLGALKAILRRADALVCNDAGARHVATAFGTPAVVLFGPTSLARTDCNLETVEIVDALAACRPCQRRECPIDHRCMTRIDPAVVIARVEALLGE